MPSRLVGLGPLVDHHGVDAFDDPAHDVGGVLFLQVDHEAALGAVDLEEAATLAVQRRGVAHAVAAGRLDLEDVGPQVGEDHGAVRAGDVFGEVGDSNAGQNAGHCGPPADRQRVRAGRKCTLDGEARGGKGRPAA